MAVRLGLVGGGWISRHHLEALERLGRTKLVGVVSRTIETGDAVTTRWGGTRYDDVDTMLAKTKPEVVYVAVPPYRAVAIGERLVQVGIPFLTEKPLAASDRGRADPAGGRDRAGRARRRRRLPPPRARHPDRGPRLARRVAAQARRRALARFDAAPGVVGQGRAGWRAGHRTGDPPVRPGATADGRGDGGRCRLDHSTSSSRGDGADVVDSTAAVLRFDAGGIGSFANTRRLASATIEIEFISEGFITTLTKRPERGQGDWHARYDDGTAIRSISNGTDPYERQATAFLDAVRCRRPEPRPVDLRRRAQDRPADPRRGRATAPRATGRRSGVGRSQMTGDSRSRRRANRSSSMRLPKGSRT